MDYEIATEGDVLLKYQAVAGGGGQTNRIPDPDQCVTKANLTNPSGMASGVKISVGGSYETNELVCEKDISFRKSTQTARIVWQNLVDTAIIQKASIGVNGTIYELDDDYQEIQIVNVPIENPLLQVTSMTVEMLYTGSSPTKLALCHQIAQHVPVTDGVEIASPNIPVDVSLKTPYNWNTSEVLKVYVII